MDRLAICKNGRALRGFQWIRADNCRTSAAKKLQRHAISDSAVGTSEPL